MIHWDERCAFGLETIGGCSVGEEQKLGPQGGMVAHGLFQHGLGEHHTRGLALHYH